MKTRVSILLMLAAFAAGCPTITTTKRGMVTEGRPIMIEDITWQLIEVAGKPAAPVPADAKAAHLRLSAADKRVSGYTGVNQFNGTYELSGNNLKFGPAAMTRMAGPPELMQQESAFGQAMQMTTYWRGAGDGIELLDTAGNPLARLSRAAN